MVVQTTGGFCPDTYKIKSRTYGSITTNISQNIQQLLSMKKIFVGIPMLFDDGIFKK